VRRTGSGDALAVRRTFVRLEDGMAKVLGNVAKTAPERAEENGEVRYDAVVVGAGTAGLSAALVLGRSRRRVLLLDGGEPRNAHSQASHGFFTRDGARPDEVLERAVLIRNWSRDLVALTDGSALGEGVRARLGVLDVPVYEGRVARLEGREDGSGATAAAFVNHALCAEDAEASSAGNGDATGGAAARSGARRSEEARPRGHLTRRTGQERRGG
jgi:FAD binding domain